MANSRLNAEKLRDIIADDPVALKKWNVVKDQFVKLEADRLRINKLLANFEFEEAILLTIQLWYSAEEDHPSLERFVGLIRACGLNRLAGALENGAGPAAEDGRTTRNPSDTNSQKNQTVNKDHFNQSGLDRSRITQLIWNGELEKAMVLTIRLWYSAEKDPSPARFVGLIRECGLVPLAGALESGVGSAVGNVRTTRNNSSTNPSSIWFGVPELIPYFTGRNEELEQLHMFLSKEDKGSEIAITGLSGIGKTAFAVSCAHKYRHHYKSVIWIEANTFDSMRSCFKKLSTELGLSSQLGYRGMADEVYKQCGVAKTLFIFDGVEDMKDFDHFKPGTDQPFLLVTSRGNVTQVEQEQVLELDTFSEKEAVSYVLDQVQPSSASEAGELVAVLQRLPGALSQAVTCMNKNRINKKTGRPIQEYIDKFKTCENDVNGKFNLLDKNTLDSIFTMTLRSLNQPAMQILEILSYLNSDFISVQFLINFAENADLSVTQLKKYGLVQDVKGSGFKIHRHLQRVIRCGLDKDNQDRILSFVTQVIEKQLEGLNENVPFTDYNKECIQHGVQLLQYQRDIHMVEKYWIKLKNCIYQCKLQDQLETCLTITKRALNELVTQADVTDFNLILIKFTVVTLNITENSIMPLLSSLTKSTLSPHECLAHNIG